MTEKITIAIDAMGGENAPIKNIQGITKRLDFETMIVSSRAEFNDIEHLIKTIPID